jgi:hypothetical protein
MERDLRRKLQHHHGYHLDVYWIYVTLDKTDGLGVVRELVPVLLPWELYAAAYSSSWAQFESSAVGPSGIETLRAYWVNAMRLPWGRAHPIAQSPQDFPFTIPLSYFIDGGEFSDGSNATITTVSSIACGRGNAYDKSFLISVLPEDRLVKDVSLGELSDFLAWCGGVLLSGKRPLTGYYGEEFPSASDRYMRLQQGDVG